MVSMFLPRDRGGTMYAIELKITVEQARKRLSSISHSVFEQGLAKHWVSGEQGELNPRSVFWLFRWALAGDSESNYRRAGEAAARVFDSMFTKSHQWLAERVTKDEADRLYRPGMEMKAEHALRQLSDD